MREFLLNDWPILLITVGAIWLLVVSLWNKIKRQQAEYIDKPWLWIYCQKGSGDIVSHSGHTAKDRPEGLDDDKPYICLHRKKPRLILPRTVLALVRGYGFSPSKYGPTLWRIEAAAANYTLIDPIGGRQSFELGELWYEDGTPTRKLNYLFDALGTYSFYAVYIRREDQWTKMFLSLIEIKWAVDSLINNGLVRFPDETIKSKSKHGLAKMLAENSEPYSFHGIWARAFLAQVKKTSTREKPN